MLDLEFGDYHIQKEKESYRLIDKRIPLGDSNIAYQNINGRTRIQNKRIRNDGYIDVYDIKLLCSYTERKYLRNMAMGQDKTSVCNKATLTLTEEGDRDTMCSVIFSDSGFYEENDYFQNIEVTKYHPSELGYNEDDILYEISIVVIRA